MKRPTKIAILHPTFKTLGGAEQHILWLAKDLVQQGYAVITRALSFSKEALTRFHNAGIKPNPFIYPSFRQAIPIVVISVSWAGDYDPI